MKRVQIIFLLFAPLLLVCSGTSQAFDWDNVKALPSGTKIKVQLKHGRTFGHCFFDGATDDQLACTVRGGFLSRREVFAKDNVKAVFRTHNGTLIGIGVGAGAGAAMGASGRTCCRGAYAFFGALAGGTVGGLVGMAADPFFHGKAVYRSATLPAQPVSPSPSPTAPKTTTAIAEETTNPPEQPIPCLRDGTTLQCVE